MGWAGIGRRGTWRAAWSRCCALVLGGLAAGLFLLVVEASSRYFDAQAAHVGELRSIVDDPGQYVRRAAVFDCLFAVAYLAFGLALLDSFAAFRTREGCPAREADPRPPNEWGTRRWRPGARAAAWLLGLAALADGVENVLLYETVDRLEDGEQITSWLGAVRGAGHVKWGLVASVLVAFVALVATRPRRPYPFGRSTDVPEDIAPDDSWEPPTDGTRLGVCLSGGGIRSASFSLGVLQELERKRLVSNARYLAAASGGGYMATAWAVSHLRRPSAESEAADGVDGADPPEPARPTTPWSQSSPEERRFRDNSSYLVPDARQGLVGALRLLAGVVVNLALLWLAFFVLARPVGWIMHAIHPELAAVEPVALPRDSTGELRLSDSVREAGTAELVVDGATISGQRYEVDLVAPEAPNARAEADDPPAAVDAAGADAEDARRQLRQLNEVCFDTEPFDPDDRQHCFGVRQASPVVLAVGAGEAVVLDQPRAELVPPAELDRCDGDPPAELETPCQVFAALEVDRQPTVGLTDTRSDDPSTLADQLEITRQARIRSTSGLADRPPLTYDSWMWVVGLGLLGGGALVGLGVMLLRPRTGSWNDGRAAASALAGAGAAVLAVTVALPWAMVDAPGALSAALGTTETVAGSGLRDYLLPSAGFLAIALAALRQYAAANRNTPAANPEIGQGQGIGRRLWEKLTGASDKLSWYQWTPGKLLAGAALVVVPVVLFVSQLQYASANGWSGRLMGFAFVRDQLPSWLWWPEWTKLLVVVGVLAAFGAAVDAHAWSLYPFYKRRLSGAYVLRRKSGNAGGTEDVKPIRYDELLPFHDLDAAGKPQLVTCCAVNLSEVGRVPPGRRAASFTFSSDYVGGPLVGYLPTKEYWDSLPEARQRDMTMPSAMAISGAAFSPAMGKFNFGPVGSVMALANLRLGVWLPHPRAVKRRSRQRWRWCRPGWWWFFRELVNRYPYDRPYLYVSDGGHWENLGLVELLRRGCTHIVCVNAGGDNQVSFGTISEGMALAREELGVEFDLDPSPLRPPIPVPGGGHGDRTLRRDGTRGTAEPMASRSYVAGTFTYPARPTDGREPGAPVTGRIWLIEPALTGDLPFDVHGYAEAEPIFPDDSTGDQIFNHRQFEAFRRLGQFQAAALAAEVDAEVDPAPAEPRRRFRLR